MNRLYRWYVRHERMIEEESSASKLSPELRERIRKELEAARGRN